MPNEYGSIPTITSEEGQLEAGQSSDDSSCLWRQVKAEFFGTYFLVQIGCGGLCAGTYLGVYGGLYSMASLWILGATLGIYMSGPISGGHLNPAVTLAFALIRKSDFCARKIVPFWIAQLAGAFVAGLVNYLVFGGAIAAYEASNDITRHSSIQSATAFGDYYVSSMEAEVVRNGLHAFFIELFGTFMLTFVIFAVTHSKSTVPTSAVPPLVGITIGCMIALLGPLTGSGINPARDLGPRLVTLIFGWGIGSMNGFWVYILGPLVGGPIGALTAEFMYK